MAARPSLMIAVFISLAHTHTHTRTHVLSRRPCRKLLQRLRRDNSYHRFHPAPILGRNIWEGLAPPHPFPSPSADPLSFLPREIPTHSLYQVRAISYTYGRVWARGRCRISPPRFLAECCKRQLNQGSFVLLYFRLSTFSDLY